MALVSDSLFREETNFIEKKLGPFKEKPILITYEESLSEIGEESPEPYMPTALVAFNGTEPNTVYYSSKIMPSDIRVQKTIILHELAEIRYEELLASHPHNSATNFCNLHWQEAGAAPKDEVEIELIKMGYFSSFVWAPEEIFRRAMKQIYLPSVFFQPPSFRYLWEERLKRENMRKLEGKG